VRVADYSHVATIHPLGLIIYVSQTTTLDGTRAIQDKQLSYRRETALQGGLVLAKSGRLERGDNI